MTNLVSYADSAWSLLPPLVAIVLAMTTRRVLLSLIAGIVSGSLLLNDFVAQPSLEYVGTQFVSQAWSDGQFDMWKIFVLVFLLLLGMMTALISTNGSMKTFALWAKEKIKNRRDAQICTVGLGILVFIDDYFNSLVVGNIARPITDRYHISRAKLAYLLYSTAAPICVLAPISSWGAYIIGLIGTVLTVHGLQDVSPLTAFVQIIPMNFYAIFALIFLAMVVYFELDIGLMNHHEQQARKGILFDDAKGTPAGVHNEFPEVGLGHLSGLFMPILLLTASSIGMMIYSGWAALLESNQVFSWIGVFENADIGLSLFVGGLCGFAASLVFSFIEKISLRNMFDACWAGIRSMLPAIYILVLAWMMSSVVDALETGRFMANLLTDHIPEFALPAVLFILATITAFSTGTSFGTFAIMLPIAADMALGTSSTLLFPFMAAVLAGAVCGDHCSPISDTTILSSTGAGCHHIDHVLTQLPYAVIVAIISVVGYLILGWSQSLPLALAACTFALFGITFWLNRKKYQMMNHISFV